MSLKLTQKTIIRRSKVPRPGGFRGLIGSILFSLLFFNLSNSQTLTWPEITPESKPWTRWWWMGSAVDSANLTYNMELYSKAGIGGLEITPIYGVRGYENQFVDFLSPKWMNLFSFTLNESKRLGLGIDLANATGWPFGGPWVAKEDACKYIAHKKYSLKQGETLQDSLVYIQSPIIRVMSRRVEMKEITDPVAQTPNLQDKALDQVRFPVPLPMVAVIAYSDSGEMIDLTANVVNNKLNWIAPPGNWTIYALFQGWHGKLVERAAPGGEGDVIDHFSEMALKNYLKHIDNVFKGYDLSLLRGYFNDSYEVDDANGEANWTPRFFDEFKVRKGYDLKRYLPLLLDRDTVEIGRRVLCDYRETVSDLLLEKFTTSWHDWSKAQGKIIRNQAHGSPANILDLYATVDIPETEGNDIVRLKFASSAAHVLDKKYVSAESATWLNEHFLSNLGDVKKAMDRYFLGGVNHNFYHGINYSPKQEQWPGWLFYAAVHFQPGNPFWYDFAKLNHYVSRCQSFLQQGHADNDVLIYFPIHEKWSERGRSLLMHFDGLERIYDRETIKTDAQLLQDKGYAFDFISDRQILLTQAANGKIQTPGGVYQTIVITEPNLIPITTFEKIIDLAKNGACLIFHKCLPADVPGLYNLESRRDKLKQMVNSLEFEALGDIKIAKLGMGKVYLGDDLDKLLNTAKIRRETMYDFGLQSVRRKTDKGTYYFISNWDTVPVDRFISLQADAKSVALFEPMFEAKGLAKIRQNVSGNVDVYLQLQPGESCILQLFKQQINAPAYVYKKISDSKFEIKGTWKVEFVEGGPELPSQTTIEKLVSWTDFAGEKGKKFSGTAKYTVEFALPNAKCDAWMLDLGKVCESAVISLNGKPVDTLVGPNFQLLLPSDLIKKSNKLEIKVSNLMANRIADLDKNGVNWKKFYNINMQARRPENRGKNGVFTAENWSPVASGLIGPVVLRAVEFMK